MGAVAEERLRRWYEEEMAELSDVEKWAYNQIGKHYRRYFFGILEEGFKDKSPRESNVDVFKIIKRGLSENQSYSYMLREIEALHKLHSIYKQGVNFLP